MDKPIKIKNKMAPRSGLEPETYGLEVRCSVQLSYRGLKPFVNRNYNTITVIGKLFLRIPV